MKITTNISTIELYEEGILIVRQKNDIEVTGDDLSESLSIYEKVCAGKKKKVILYIGQHVQFSEDAVKFKALQKQNELFSAQAVVLTDLPQRILLNFYFNKHPSEYARQIFSTEDEARAWLLLQE